MACVRSAREALLGVYDDVQMLKPKYRTAARSATRAIRLVTFIVVAFMAVGCDESPTASSSEVATKLAGTWNLVSIQPTAQAVQVTPANTSYTLTLTDGDMSTRVDCNVCNGTFTVSGPRLTIGPLLACTRAACQTLAFGNAYTSLLTGENTITLSPAALVLSSSRGVVRFAR